MRSKTLRLNETPNAVRSKWVVREDFDTLFTSDPHIQPPPKPCGLYTNSVFGVQKCSEPNPPTPQTPLYIDFSQLIPKEILEPSMPPLILYPPSFLTSFSARQTHLNPPIKMLLGRVKDPKQPAGPTWCDPSKTLECSYCSEKL